MPKKLMCLVFGASTCAAVDAWAPVGDKARPNCAARSCVINEGSTSFEIGMTTESRKGLEYLDHITIKNRATGQSQEFETSAVNASEHGEPFKLYRVQLQKPGVNDLALMAYTSAAAGPSYYYFLYDGATQTFKASEDTVPKLNHDRKTKSLKSDLQDVEYVIEDFKLREK